MITFRPIEMWPRTWTKTRRNSPFQADYKDTLEKLEYEIEQLRGRNIVIQLAITEDDLRNDGWPRASARPAHPGIIVSFECRHGALSFACDEFHNSIGKQGWQANLRGIALTLERLRLADLYGVTKSGEQYTGWKQIPAAPSGISPEDSAATILLSATGCKFTVEQVRRVASEAEYFKLVYRNAAQRVHPDRGGTHEDMQSVNQAAMLLRKKFGI